jgi:NADP-dependent 3-hydroxy acid dehydrogenase YdfG
MSTQLTAVITGASSGIGAATAEALAKAGYVPVVGARRVDRLQELVERIGGSAHVLDVTDPDSIAEFVDRITDAAVLVNNAGGALGLEPVADAIDEKWIRMFETNVLGSMRMTRALLPTLERSGRGHIVNVGSIAAFEVYPGGGGYTAAKHAVRAFTGTLRLELLGKPIRVTEVDPGLVETEFSLVRFDGDAEKAGRPYAGMTPLTAADVAEAIVWAVTRPPHVNIDQIVIRPTDQATATLVHRTPAK